MPAPPVGPAAGAHDLPLTHESVTLVDASPAHAQPGPHGRRHPDLGHHGRGAGRRRPLAAGPVRPRIRLGPPAYAHIVDTIAAAGYVVVAPSFTLADAAVAGPNIDRGDIPNQSGDLRFVADHLPAGVRARVDASRIGAVGHSDGADTVLDLGYHRNRRSPAAGRGRALGRRCGPARRRRAAAAACARQRRPHHAVQRERHSVRPRAGAPVAGHPDRRRPPARCAGDGAGRGLWSGPCSRSSTGRWRGGSCRRRTCRPSQPRAWPSCGPRAEPEPHRRSSTSEGAQATAERGMWPCHAFARAISCRWLFCACFEAAGVPEEPHGREPGGRRSADRTRAAGRGQRVRRGARPAVSGPTEYQRFDLSVARSLCEAAAAMKRDHRADRDLRRISELIHLGDMPHQVGGDPAVV